jgi:hypothetical protein
MTFKPSEATLAYWNRSKRRLVQPEYIDQLEAHIGLKAPASYRELLIEFGQQTEKIHYWDFDKHDWESGETRLGFVAEDFYQFINSLVPYDGPE